MRNIPCELTMFVLLLISWVSLVVGHGRLWEPPGRPTMWRRDFKTPIDYDDNALNCGGFNHQVSLGYKCGLCGDPYDGVRENERGGKFATGIISKIFNQGKTALFQVDLTANHKGYFEFKICQTDDPNEKETQACFDQNTIQLAASSGSGTRYYVDDETKMFNIEVQLPPNLTCKWCVLQWRYHGGNNWGTDPDGRSCIGCGPQEEFYGCADISILPSPDTDTEDVRTEPTNQTRQAE